MAIIIPSRSIYQKENPKVRDNALSRIEVNCYNAEIVSNNETGILNKSYAIQSLTADTLNSEISNLTPIDVRGTSVAVVMGAYVKYETPKHTEIITLRIPKLQNNNTCVSNINFSSETGSPNISYSLIGKILTGTAKTTVDYYVSNISDLKLTLNQEITKTQTSVKENATFSIPNPLTYSYTGTMFLGAEYTVTSSVNFIGNGVSSSAPKTIIDNDTGIEYYEIKIFVYAGVTTYEMGGHLDIPQKEYTSGTVDFNGTYTTYIGERLELTVYGSTISVDLKDKTIVLGDSTSKNGISIEANELLQSDNRFGSYESPYFAIDTVYNEVLSEYSNGKETATIRCSINDYYDENGDLAISANKNNELPMTFKLYDKVIPMVFRTNGKDSAMSSYNNGDAKIFQVVGIKPKYNGAVWQELTLQEVRK